MSRNNSEKNKGMVEALNHFFKNLAGFTYDRRLLMSCVCLIVLSVCGYLASSVQFDNSFESFFDKTDPVYQQFLTFRADFGSDEISYILYEVPDREHGAWDLSAMETIRDLTRELEKKVPFVKRAVSLPNVEFLEGKDDTLYIHDLLKEFPESQNKLLDIRERVLKKAVYVDGLASRDGRFGAIILEMEKSSIDPTSDLQVESEKGNALSNLYPQATCEAIDTILERYRTSGILFYHTGDVPLNAAYNIITQKESTSLGLVTFIVIGVFFLLFFRSFVGVVGPLLVVLFSIMMTVGFMGLLGWQFDIMFIMLPTILIAVGVADSVHIISDFNTHYRSVADRREAIKRTAYLTGVPCLFTSLTTTAGFISMSVSPIKAIKHFAIYSGVGATSAFLLSITALIVCTSFGKKEPPIARQDASQHTKKMVSILSWITAVNIRHKRSIVAFFALLFIFCASGISRITIDSNLLSEFSDKVAVKRVSQYADSVMGGSISYSYIFDTGDNDGVMEPAVLQAIDKLQQKAEEDDIVLKTSSIVDIIKDINRSLHNEDDAYNRLPETRDMAAQLFLLYEMSGGDELKNFVTTDYSRTNLEIRTAMVDSSRTKKLIDTLDATITSMGLSIETPSVTGIGALWYKLIDYIVESQIMGFSLAFIVISLMMCLLFRSVKVGLLSMIPNLTPVILILGFMGWAGIPLDYVKLLIGCIAIGIAVDDTIHLVTRFRHEFARTGDYETALYESMTHVGKALVITSIALVFGFLVLTFSVMASMVMFAILVASTIVVALAADFFLLPSLFLILKPFATEEGAELEQGLDPVNVKLKS
jgi:predicted RND superfamily exporter protein